METEPSMSRTQFLSVAEGEQQGQQKLGQQQQKQPSPLQQQQSLSLEPKQEITGSPEIEAIENMNHATNADTQMSNAASTSASIAGSIQQPKVQTAFIHKLYKYVSSCIKILQT